MLGNHKESLADLDKAKTLLGNLAEEQEKSELKQQIEIIEKKVQLEMTNVKSIGDVNQAAFLPSSKANKEAPAPIQPKPLHPSIDPKYDWY